MLRAVATQVVEEGDDAGVLLDRFDAGRHVLIRALLESGAGAEAASQADDRLRLAQSAARTAIRDAQAGYEAVIDAAVAEVSRAIEDGAAPEEAMQVAAASLSGLVNADRARVWLEAGGGRLELVASAGSASPSGFYVSSDKGVLAEIMHGAEAVRQCPVDPTQWAAAVPTLPIPGAALFLPLATVGRPFGLVYALRNAPDAFSDSAMRRASRFVERVEPALAWAMQLRSVQRWAEASQDFLRITTHELRRPLTVLRGYLDMIGDVEPQEATVLMERISRAADQLAELLSGVTDTVTLEDPARNLTLRRVRVGDILETVVGNAADEAAQQGVTMWVESTADDVVMQCDVDNVQHALANLLSNAFRHTQGERRVWLEAASDGARYVRFAVRDEGIGFDEAEADKLFEKYYRSDATRRSTSPGSGLGLYFVRLVAERHSGRATAENVPGNGARFTLELPLEPGLVPWSM
ncbi:MAG TPA: HAMP domain-containing sensor histidine kinase [Candidatus Dormibacteraeota bacterium]|nr:HAMP domain-containing sensor histidine kinase [Candidatus Dormibacteraeota bacterium]